MVEPLVPFTLAACFMLLAVALVGSGIRIVPEHRRMVVFRLGRVVGPRGPGLIMLMPLVDRGVPVDLREQVREVKGAKLDTWEKIPVSLDLVVRYRVTDTVQSVLQVASLDEALNNAAIGALQEVTRGLGWADLTAGPGDLSRDLQARLRPIVAAWGIELTGVEIRSIARR
jgi:regulator of protease activity HflC (stomatin/prohibitin superfamily)